MKSNLLVAVLVSLFIGSAVAGVQYSGFINTDAKRNHNLFYWFFESQSNASTDPLVLWLNGGPGASSIVPGLLYEHGPILMTGGATPSTNPYSWNLLSNMLYLDQPVGAGFSYASSEIDYYSSSTVEMMEEVIVFLAKFYALYPKYSQLPFYITTESYGGHYATALGYLILKHNQQVSAGQASGPIIPLAGVALGNAWVNPAIQFKSYIDFAVAHNLISDILATVLYDVYPECLSLISQQRYAESLPVCMVIPGSILGANPGMEMYDIRKKDCPGLFDHDCYNFTAGETWLNWPSTRNQLGVGNHEWYDREIFMVVSRAFRDFELSFEDWVPKLLSSGVRVLVYSGEYDLSCNWMGGEAWTTSMQWSGQSQFNSTAYTNWNVGGQPAGVFRTVQNFTFLKFFNAGHMVPMNQPKNALDMFSRFLKNQPYN